MNRSSERPSGGGPTMVLCASTGAPKMAFAVGRVAPPSIDRLAPVAPVIGRGNVRRRVDRRIRLPCVASRRVGRVFRRLSCGVEAERVTLPTVGPALIGGDVAAVGQI